MMDVDNKQADTFSVCDKSQENHKNDEGNVKVKLQASENQTATDQFAYTKTERFTSEVFKIEIGNLPRFLGYGECKKLLSKKLKLKPHKINVVKNINKAYVTFKNEEDKLEAVEKLQNYLHKGKKFDVKNAKPKADAMAASKRSSENTLDQPASKRPKEGPDLSSEEILKNSVIPWWRKSYDEQLEEKHGAICSSLVETRKKICAVDNLDKEIFRMLMKQKKEGNRCCPTKPIISSPVTSGYRNKCGFSVGMSTTGEKTVGFRLGKYRHHTCAVEPPTCLVHVSDQMKNIAESFSGYVRQSKLDIYDRQTHTGHWRQLLLRTSRSGMVMATIALSQQNVSDGDIEAEKQAVKDYFALQGLHIDTLLFRVVSDESKSTIEAFPAITFSGEGVIYENLFDLKFRISPDAFFQCNTIGAELLYDCVKNMALKKVVNETEFVDSEENNDIVLLDVCCGTGTIGLCLAKHVQKVIGIDICKEAIEDAAINAKLNNITNVEFRCNKAEEVLQDVLRQAAQTATSIVAVVDPPRCGLHHKVIKAIRQCSLIKKLVFVSCSADQARHNFVDLCRPISNRFQGLPFMPVLAQPVDLFPHTAHCELVLLFERIEKENQTINNDMQQESTNQASNNTMQRDLRESESGDHTRQQESLNLPTNSNKQEKSSEIHSTDNAMRQESTENIATDISMLQESTENLQTCKK